MDVVKIGGARGIPLDALARDLAAHHRAGRELVVVHGGSDEANRLGEALGRPPHFLVSPSGQLGRRTDRGTLEIFVQATALVNRRLVEALRRAGADALGLSGLDGGLIEARRKETVRAVVDGRVLVFRDDWTGRPLRVNARLLRLLLAAGHLPVVAPLGAGADGAMLNLDGDRAAATIAAGLGAARLVILSNVPGLLRDPADPSSLIERVGPRDWDDAEACAAGRMRKKLLGAREALAGGVAEVILADGRVEHPLAAALAGGGTRLAPPAATSTPAWAAEAAR